MPGKPRPVIALAQHAIKINVQFIVLCAVAFFFSVAATIYFYFSINSNMSMPGGWHMSMMWMRMPGQTWLASFLSFMIMWLAMMVAMMLPSALPMFLKIKKQWQFLSLTAIGYFTVWLVAGIVFYILGVMLADAAMQSETFSIAVPLLFGFVLILAGLYQFSRYKISNLLHCRSSFGCTISLLNHKTGFQLGCKQGIICCICCSGLMIIQVVIGIMNPFLMITIAVIIAVEKLFPKPKILVKVIGAVAIVAGVSGIFNWMLLNN